jgi:hypothetical protein
MAIDLGGFFDTLSRIAASFMDVKEVSEKSRLEKINGYVIGIIALSIALLGLMASTSDLVTQTILPAFNAAVPVLSTTASFLQAVPFIGTAVYAASLCYGLYELGKLLNEVSKMERSELTQEKMIEIAKKSFEVILSALIVAAAIAALVNPVTGPVLVGALIAVASVKLVILAVEHRQQIFDFFKSLPEKLLRLAVAPINFALAAIDKSRQFINSVTEGVKSFISAMIGRVDSKEQQVDPAKQTVDSNQPSTKTLPNAMNSSFTSSHESVKSLSAGAADLSSKQMVPEKYSRKKY